MNFVLSPGANELKIYKHMIFRLLKTLAVRGKRKFGLIMFQKSKKTFPSVCRGVTIGIKGSKDLNKATSFQNKYKNKCLIL